METSCSDAPRMHQGRKRHRSSHLWFRRYGFIVAQLLEHRGCGLRFRLRLRLRLC